MSKESYIRGFCKYAESKGVNPIRLVNRCGQMRKQGGFVEDVKNAIDEAAARYAQLGDGARMAISAAGAGAVGAGVGRMMSKKKNKTKGAILGALIGAGAGAAANPFVNAPDWLKNKAFAGSVSMANKDPSREKEIGRKFLTWLAGNSDGIERAAINEHLGNIQ